MFPDNILHHIGETRVWKKKKKTYKKICSRREAAAGEAAPFVIRCSGAAAELQPLPGSAAGRRAGPEPGIASSGAGLPLFVSSWAFLPPLSTQKPAPSAAE